MKTKTPYFYTWSKQQDGPIYHLQKASSSTIETSDYGSLIDLISTSFHLILGYQHPSLIKAIRTQASLAYAAHPKSFSKLKWQVSQELLSFMQLKKGKIFYTVSGAESIENALKIARQIKNASLVLARERSYHGASLGALSITGDWRNKEHQTLDHWTLRIPDFDTDPQGSQLEELIVKTGAHKIAAICLEPVTGMNNVLIPPKSWIKKVRLLCDKYNIFLIFDEVVTGFYRLGTPFAFHYFNILPDMVCMSKGMTAGAIPFGGLWCHPKIAEFYDDHIFSCGLTNYAHPLGLSVCSAVIKQLKTKKISKMRINLEQNLKQFKNELSNHPDKIAKIRLLGSIMAIETFKMLPSLKEFIQMGVYLGVKDKMLILAPSYTTSNKELKQGLQTLKEILIYD